MFRRRRKLSKSDKFRYIRIRGWRREPVYLRDYERTGWPLNSRPVAEYALRTLFLLINILGATSFLLKQDKMYEERLFNSISLKIGILLRPLGFAS